MFSNALEWAEHFEDLAERDPVGLKRELKLYNRKLRVGRKVSLWLLYQ